MSILDHLGETDTAEGDEVCGLCSRLIHEGETYTNSYLGTSGKRSGGLPVYGIVCDLCTHVPF